MAHLYFNTSRSVFLFDQSLRGIAWIDSGGGRVLREGILEPSYNSPKDQKPDLDKIKFGDGYEQVALAGINSTQEVFSLNFNKKRRAVAAAMNRFFKGEPEGSIYNRDPSQWFWWLPPYPLAGLGSLPMKVRCENWNVTPVEYDSVNITANFLQSFEP
jgi:phage-related protein